MLNKELYLKIGGLDSEPEETFNNFEPKEHLTPADRKITQIIKDKVLDWTLQDEDSKPILALFGNTGVGKTHLLKASINVLAENCKRFTYLNSGRFTRAMKNFQTQEELSPFDMKNECWDVENLIFDELGFWDQSLKNGRNYLNQELDEILIYRADYKKRTLLAGNIRSNSKILTPRFKSRLKDDTLVELFDLWKVSDFRPLKNDQAYRYNEED
jgi:chromosomal replication initiation ATPase DnaA